MCGIAGYFAHAPFAVPPARVALAAMRDRMATRGPDGAGEWFSPGDRVGFGHRRLSIIALGHEGAQPMHSADGALVVTFNGEIYNHAALRAELEAQGCVFASHSDTEVLLHLYAVHGAAMLPRLRGMFAFALWDARAERLLLARDPYGIKPLYYGDAGGVVRFASQVKALVADSAVSREVSAAGLAGFHLLGSVPEPFTIYEGLRALAAGHSLVVDRTGVGTPRRYAAVGATLAAVTPAPPDRNAIAAALRDSVAAHLVADVEVGAFLSGGVDSGALVGLMRDCGQDRIRTCTLQFAEFAGHERDEVPRAAQVAAHYGVEHHVRQVARAEFEADLPLILDAMDQPSVDGINSWFVSKATRELGLKVALSGLGGDELLAGYSTFVSVPRMHRRAGPLARVPGAGGLSRALLGRLAPGLAARNPKALGVLSYAGSWAGSWLLRRSVMLPDELDAVLARGLEELAPLDLIAAELSPDPGSDNGRVCALESGLYMKNQLLRDTDWASMAHSLEVRVPLVDHTLLAAIAPYVPALRPGDGKALLAAAPSRPLPPAIAAHGKTGFSVPVAAWQAGAAQARPDRRDSRTWSKSVLARYLDQGDPALLSSAA